MKPTVLVVDDSEPIREVTSGMLRDAGYDVLEAGTGAEGLRLARARPDLVVLDVHLPDVDGFEVCRRLKADGETASIPILYLSGTYRGVEDKVRGLDTGADGYLTKPVGSAELTATVRALLRLRMAEGGLRESEARRQAAEALAQVGRLVTQSLDVEEVGQRIADSLRDLQHARFALLYRLDPDSGASRVLAVSGGMGGVLGRLEVLPPGVGLVGLTVRERKLLVTPNVLTDARITFPPELRARIERGHFRSVLTAPLVAHGQVIGSLAVADREGRLYSDDEIRLIQAFADQASVALENARLYQETRQAYDELSRTKDQLSQAQKMEAIGQLAGGIAHDFNNLLTVIIGRSEILRSRLEGDAALGRHVELLRQTAYRAADLTRQLLAFSRKQILQPRALDLNALVTGIEKMLRRLIGEHIGFTTVLAPDLGAVRADPGQLEQVIMNLVVNARDAMPQGGRVTIETANVELDSAFVRSHPGSRPGSYVMLAVSDTGAGMDQATQMRLFEPFFTTKGPGRGTGLGLATVYGIVKQSDGYITVESAPGRGARFGIYLPRIAVRAEPPDAPAAPAETALGSETILLVEDETGLRDLAREVLQQEGYRVLEARHGPDAFLVAEAHEGPIHLLTTDVVMPHMSGRELAERLAALHPEMAVLYMSGHTDDAIVQHGALAPGTAFLPKPFTPDALLQRVRQVLDAACGGTSR